MKTLVQNTQVDTLGLLLAQQADLTAKIDAIKANLKEEGQGIYEGAMYIARNTKAQEIITVKITSR